MRTPNLDEYDMEGNEEIFGVPTEDLNSYAEYKREHTEEPEDEWLRRTR